MSFTNRVPIGSSYLEERFRNCQYYFRRQGEQIEDMGKHLNFDEDGIGTFKPKSLIHNVVVPLIEDYPPELESDYSSCTTVEPEEASINQVPISIVHSQGKHQNSTYYFSWQGCLIKEMGKFLNFDENGIGTFINSSARRIRLVPLSNEASPQEQSDASSICNSSGQSVSLQQKKDTYY
jgi:hypothetical protein